MTPKMTPHFVSTFLLRDTINVITLKQKDMWRIKFYLKSPSAKTSSQMMVSLIQNKDRARKSIGFKMHPNLWLQKKQMINFQEAPKLLAKLKLVEAKINEIKDFVDDINVSQIKNSKLLSKMEIEQLFDQRFNKKHIEHSKSEYLLAYINDLTENATEFKKSTIQAYKECRDNLLQYLEDKYHKDDIAFNEVDMIFGRGFHRFLIGKEYTKNSVAKHIKNFRAAMSKAFEDDLHTNSVFRKRDFRPKWENVDYPHLSLNELELIEKCDLSFDDQLSKIRDVFLIESNMGMRYSEMQRFDTINIEKIEDDKWIATLKSLKTGATVVLPIRFKAIELLKKYNCKLPISISNNKYNEALKVIGEEAGLYDDFTVCRTRGNQPENITKPKYKLLTSHTSRRSFCTNATENGVSETDTAYCAGMVKEETLRRYIKSTKRTNALRIANHEFFKRPEENKK